VDRGTPRGEVPGKKECVEAMFNDIAPRYDLLNRLLSFGIDQMWRNRTIESLREKAPRRILDVATGTGDLAIKALSLEPEKIDAVDISEEMLALARQKVERLGVSDRIALQRGDAEKLPFSDAQFDAAMVAFGVRNFEDLQAGLAEIRRVLRPGGWLVILEFSHPHAFPVKQLYGFYSHVILPTIGSIISRNDEAYRYLPESVDVFPSGSAFLERLKSAGFNEVEWRSLTFGVAAIYRGVKSKE
jgi:demethylmenaquinone methyltransferase/2-methoxy-6-polyprenyl-1,4-benzoquinol methylase